MRIRNILVAGIALAFLLVAIQLILLEAGRREAMRLGQFQLQVERISRDSAALLILSQDYLMHGNARADRQWHEVHASVTRTLPLASQYSSDLQASFAALRETAQGLPELFDALKRATIDPDRANARPRQDMLAEHLLTETGRISDGAFELSEKLSDIRHARELVERRVTQATVAAFATLVLAVGAVVWRRVLRPMAEMDAAARAIGRGDLAVRSNYCANDEFGRLSSNFDAMTQSLQERTASAEASRAALRDTLNAIPAVIGYWDRDLLNRFANHAYRSWFGIAEDRMPGLHLAVVLGDHYEESRPYIEAALRGETQVFERALRRPDGQGSRQSITHYVPNVVDGEVRGFYCCIHDITEQTRDRSRLAAALRENEALLSTIRLHAIFSVADRAGTIIDANDNFCRITGYSREELLGQNHRIVNSAAQGPEFWVDMWRTIASGKPWRGEICNRAKDGSLYWVDSIVAPFIGEDGRIDKYISVRTDITAAKLSEQRLRASEASLDRTGRIAGVGGWELDMRSQTLTWTAQTYRIHEVDADYVPSIESVMGFYAADVRVTLERGLAEGAANGGVWDMELPFVTAKGRPRWMHLVGQSEMEAGQVVRLVGAVQDITDARHADMALRETSSLLQGVLESASEVSIIATDPELRITVFNAGAERLLGYAGAELVGHATPLLIHDAGEVARRGIELSEALGRPVEGAAVFTDPTTLRQPREWTYVRKNGSRVAVSVVVTAMRRDNGELFGYLGIAHDVTRQKEYEESLRLAMHKARQANSAKSQFLANMSHEIRTPMNAVIGLAYLFGQTRLDEQQANYLGKLKIASNSLLMLINDVLDLSKIEANEVMVEHAPFSPRSLLKSLGDVMVEQARAKRIAFEIEIVGDLPQALLGDAMRLGQVLTNLTSNAIKFTDTGAVRLRVSQTAATAEATTLQLSVRDSGIGMAPATLNRLFKPFAQADSSTTRRFGGTGLGLSIVKRLTTLMGGTVTVTSSPGVGSEFRVELTLTVAPPEALMALAAASPAPDQRGLRGLRVLIADDSEINLDVAQRILELEGARVTLAGNGQEAFALMQAGPVAFDVVLMDVQMPVLDGYEATRRIRGELGLSVPIIALTAGALTSERRRAIDAGMNDFITKPFDPRELVRTLAQHLRPLPAGAQAPGDAQPASPVSTGAAWPEIDGIDSADVSQRLCGDSALFRSMLKRLFKEFDAVSIAPSDAVPVTSHAARMHKLKGSAGMLGAAAVHRLAGDAETACRAGDAALAAGHSVQLAEHLLRLKESCTAFLSEAVAPADAPPATGAVAVESQVVEQLIDMLRKQSLSATKQFLALASELANLTGAQRYEQLCDHMENLRFGAAAQLLDDACRQRRETGARQ